jgi:hypothetical protein
MYRYEPIQAARVSRLPSILGLAVLDARCRLPQTERRVLCLLLTLSPSHCLNKEFPIEHR